MNNFSLGMIMFSSVTLAIYNSFHWHLKIGLLNGFSVEMALK